MLLKHFSQIVICYIVTNMSLLLGVVQEVTSHIHGDGTQLTHNEYAAFRSSSVYKKCTYNSYFLDTGVSDTNSHAYKFRAKKGGWNWR